MKLPNFLTLSRIAISPLFILFFMIDSLWSLIVCMILFILIEITDFLDGQIARGTQQITVFGKLMDPFADSIARFTIFLSFLSAGLAPVWMIAIFFYRDVLVAIIRVFSIKEGVVVAARKSGKQKAMAQGIGIFFILIYLLLEKSGHLPPGLETLWNIKLPTIILAVAALVTLYSGIDYWNGNKSIVINSLTQAEN
jgi:CDP-diacylglycerol--glycerol-3-phosphate 3-phosphatidyltransferase